MGKTLDAAINELAALKFGWALQASTDAADFILNVAEEIKSLRAELAETNAELLQQAEIIGRDIDAHDKVMMEKRGVECDLERVEAELAEVTAERNRLGLYALKMIQCGSVCAAVATRRRDNIGMDACVLEWDTICKNFEGTDHNA